MLNKSNITWSAKQVNRMMDSGKLTFQNVVQRSYVWETTRKSELIHSMIEGYPIPPFYAKRVDGKVYDFLDGKQRMNAITSFLSDGYALTGIDEVETEEGTTEDINGKLFSELSEELQDRIRDYSLTIYYFDGITDEQTRTLFKKLNNGKPLSTKDKNIANCVDIVSVSDIGKHPLFNKIMTEKSLEGRKHLPVIMKIYMMITRELIDISFESKDFNEVISTAIMADEEKQEILDILDKASSVYDILSERKDKVKAKLKNETHLVSLIPFFKKGIEEGIEDSLIADFISNFFENVAPEYTEASTKGSAKATNIITRHDCLEEAWEDFFKETENKEGE